MKGKSAICALTHEQCELRLSHLYPRFLWNYLKETGGDKFRSTVNPTEVLQDGIKCHLLGHRAEQMFSIREKWFAENIFKPFCSGDIVRSKLVYDERLYYFIVSLIWRICYCSIENIIEPSVKEKCNIALEEWRTYLLNGIVPPTFPYFYMMPITPDYLFSPSLSITADFRIPYEYYENNRGEFYDINTYLLREFDREIFCDLPHNRAFYCKVPRFIFWAVLERDNTNINYGMRISPSGGRLDFKRYAIGAGEIKTYLLRRIVNVNREYVRARSRISENSQDKAIKRILNNPRFRGSELAQLIVERGLAES